MTHPPLVAAMLRPDFYPHRPDRIDLVQTHISWIFLAGNEVYKVKKPVNFGFLDFTTLEKRDFFCREEWRLNRRLAPDVYLGVVPVREGPGGLPALSGEGPVIDYAVRMRRLPPERMLKRMLRRGEVDATIMDAIAERIARFHDGAARGSAIDDMGSGEVIRRNHGENFHQTEPYIGVTIDPHRHRFIRAYSETFLDRHAALFAERVRRGRIRECHGDLHLEHICLENGIVVFDCIEFNERFRCGDVAAEVAFLAMDLDFNGFPAEAKAFADGYVRHAGDGDIPVLLPFYQCYYAFVRGKVTGFRLQDPGVDPAAREEILRTANTYFALAYRYAARPENPMLIVMAGLTGTGKSVLARAIAPDLGAEVVRTDVLRKEMAGIPVAEHRYAAFGEGIYGEDLTARTYAEALRRAGEGLRAGRSVILDGSYGKRSDREAAIALAKERNVPFAVLECTCGEDTARDRIENRRGEPGEASDGHWEVYQGQKQRFEPVTETSSRLVIDTARAAETGAREAMEFLRFGRRL